MELQLGVLFGLLKDFHFPLEPNLVSLGQSFKMSFFRGRDVFPTLRNHCGQTLETNPAIIATLASTIRKILVNFKTMMSKKEVVTIETALGSLHRDNQKWL